MKEIPVCGKKSEEKPMRRKKSFSAINLYQLSSTMKNSKVNFQKMTSKILQKLQIYLKHLLNINSLEISRNCSHLF